MESPKYTFRSLMASDREFLKEMIFLSIHVREEQDPFPKSILAHPGIVKYYTDWGASTDHGIIVQDQEQKIGAIWSRQFTKANKGYGFVNEETPELGIAIKEGYRNQGLGHILMNQLFDVLKQHQVKSISLSVDNQNPSIRLYERNGFQILEENGTAITMFRRLI